MSEQKALTAEEIGALQQAHWDGPFNESKNALCDMALESIELREELAEEKAHHVKWLEMHGIEVEHAYLDKLAAERRAERAERELTNFVKADRYHGFVSDSEFADWCLSRARAALQEAK